LQLQNVGEVFVALVANLLGSTLQSEVLRYKRQKQVELTSIVIKSLF
jgi:hypothetical protein